MTGDQRVGPDQSEPGNLDADGDLGFGRTGGTQDQVGGKLRYFWQDKKIAFDASLPDATFTWNDSASETIEQPKMKLDANNVLSLYKSDGSTAPITLTPDTGAIKLTGTGAGIFNATGGGVLQIDSSGRPYFSTKPIFQQGIDFGGSAGTLDSGKVEYLQEILTTLGYDPNEASYTDVTKLVSEPYVTVQQAAYANGYIHWTGYLSGGTAKIGNNTYYESNGRILVVKADVAGNVAWVKQIKLGSDTFNPHLSINGISVNGAGTVALTGAINGATTNLGSQNLVAGGGTDAYVLVLNSSGVPQWSKVVSSSGTAPDEGYAVAIDASGNVVATGQVQGTTINFGNGVLTSAGGFSDGFAVKYNSSGVAQWSMLAGGTAYDSIRSVAIAPSGNAILGGIGGTTTNLGAHNITSAGSTDGWVASVSSSGTLQWTKAIGGTAADDTRGLAVDSSGTVYALATFVGTTTTLGSYNKTSAGSNDALVVALGSGGLVQWATAIGGAAADVGNRIVVDSAGVLVVSGTIGGSTTNLGAYNITGKGSSDGFTVMLESSGAPVAAQGIGGMGSDTLLGAFPIGSLSSGLFLVGYVGTNATVGDTRIPSGNYVVSVPQSSIVTRPPATVTGLDWNGGLATGTEGVAIGSRAFSQGLGAVALGSSSSTGAWSFAAGSGRAKGDYSFAMGQDSTATGESATALGRYSAAIGHSSLAAGEGAYAASIGAVALGSATQAIGDYSFAAGWAAQATEYTAVAIGEFAVANGPGSVSLGPYNTANGEYSMALGVGTVTEGLYSFAGGLATYADSYASTALGTQNIGGGSASTWVETDPLLEVGNSNSGQRTNALTLLKNGRTTLTNKAWRANIGNPLADPSDPNDSGGTALIVEGHTELKGKVIISEPQGDISMGIYGDN